MAESEADAHLIAWERWIDSYEYINKTAVDTGLHHDWAIMDKTDCLSDYEREVRVMPDWYLKWRDKHKNKGDGDE